MGELKPDAVHGFRPGAKLCCIESVLAGYGPLVRKMQKTDIPLAPSGLFIALLLCAGCTANHLSQNIASWQGSHIDEVEAAWGAPAKCGPQGNQTLCVWTDRVAAKSVAPAPETNIELAQPALLPRPACIRTLAIDSSGYVTGWRLRGTRCPNSIAVARTE